MSSISKQLKTMRLARNLSMREAAQLIGVPETTYREWEYGRQIRGEPYKKIAKAFSVTLNNQYDLWSVLFDQSYNYNIAYKEMESDVASLIQYLISQGAPLNGQRYNQSPIYALLKWLYALDSDKQPAFSHYADIFLKAGTKADANSLKKAVSLGSVVFVEKLCAFGADKNEKSDGLTSALDDAHELGNANVLKALDKCK